MARITDRHCLPGTEIAKLPKKENANAAIYVRAIRDHLNVKVTCNFQNMLASRRLLLLLLPTSSETD